MVGQNPPRRLLAIRSGMYDVDPVSVSVPVSVPVSVSVPETSTTECWACHGTARSETRGDSWHGLPSSAETGTEIGRIHHPAGRRPVK